MGERYFSLFTSPFMHLQIYLAVKDENHALRFEARYDCDHAAWRDPSIEYHSKYSKSDDDTHTCGMFGEDTCNMHHDDKLTIAFSNECCDALNLDGTDKVYEMLEKVWEQRPKWMKEKE